VRLILASASPRRAELLRAAGFEFDIVAVAVNETVRDGESPAAYVRRLAADKSARAADVARPFQGRGRGKVGRALQDVVILGADTAVVVDGEILGKPRDAGDAAAMLWRLSGRRHDVLTGVSLRRGAHELGRVETSAVSFAPLSAGDIAWYIASAEWRDKAGAYAIQGRASRFIPRIDGSYSNVVGLPVACVYELMAAFRSP
jgi:septum formation protein